MTGDEGRGLKLEVATEENACFGEGGYLICYRKEFVKPWGSNFRLASIEHRTAKFEKI